MRILVWQLTLSVSSSDYISTHPDNTSPSMSLTGGHHVRSSTPFVLDILPPGITLYHHIHRALMGHVTCFPVHHIHSSLGVVRHVFRRPSYLLKTSRSIALGRHRHRSQITRLPWHKIYDIFKCFRVRKRAKTPRRLP